MRDQARSTPRPPRTYPPTHRHPGADHPLDRMPPPGQHTPTARTAQPTRRQPRLDPRSLTPYRDHSASVHTRRPSRRVAKRDREGRHPSDRDHGAAGHHQRTTPNPPQTPKPTLSDEQTELRTHLTRRLTRWPRRGQFDDRLARWQVEPTRWRSSPGSARSSGAGPRYRSVVSSKSFTGLDGYLW
jgi:hypothetical protein